MDEHLHPDREARPKVTVVSAEQAESFAILRRPRIESDRLPESHREMFEGGLIERCGLNRRLVAIVAQPAELASELGTPAGIAGGLVGCLAALIVTVG